MSCGEGTDKDKVSTVTLITLSDILQAPGKTGYNGCYHYYAKQLAEEDSTRTPGLLELESK